jgi:hypothetical protein
MKNKRSTRANLAGARARVTSAFTAVALFALAIIGIRAWAAAQPLLERIDLSKLCVTEGTLTQLPGDKLSVTASKMRAYVNRSSSQVIEARFKYLGPTENESKLGSGQVRQQFGLKLRAQDACNLVYAMWRIEPENKLVVSVKSNPSQHTSAECGNRGYRNIKPAHSSPLPPLRTGDTHSMRGELRGDALQVFVDNRVVWEGQVDVGGPAADAPVGIRSDNAKLELEIRAGTAADSNSGAVLPCKTGASESEL